MKKTFHKVVTKQEKVKKVKKKKENVNHFLIFLSVKYKRVERQLISFNGGEVENKIIEQIEKKDLPISQHKLIRVER